MAISTVVDLSGTQPDLVVQDLLASNSGISVVAGSVSLLASGPGAVNLFDAATGASLGLGSAGVLLTSGATPGTSNTLTWFGADNSGSSGFNNGDADIDAVVNTVFQTQSYDATTLSFNFNVADPAATSISFDLVFGSEEYPEWVDAFVDCAVVIVDGVNYALFNKDAKAPLSVISPNLAAGYFQDNAAGTIPIEYDGVSGLLRIVAPLAAGLSTHTIKIGIADTGDHILDSGLFIANMRAGTDPGSGVVSNPGGGSAGNDICTGSSKDEYFDLQAGDDTVYAGGGADIVVAGAGNDQVFAGSGDDELKGDGGNDLLDGGADLDTAVYGAASCDYVISYDIATDRYTIDASSLGEGIDTLLNVEQLMFSDGLFSLLPAGLSSAASTPSPTPANSAGSVLITDAFGNSLTGPAGPDTTLIASVSDPDGLSGAVAYQWLRDGVALVSADASTYVVQEADLGHFLSVAVTYSDEQGQQENHTSQSLLALPANGDLLLTLMSIEGPSSASVYTPITTLLLRAIELGETPNMAIQKIRSALNVPQNVGSLLSTNAYGILQAGGNAVALALAKLEAQVAILCSSANDQTGLQLAQSLLALADSGASIDLASATDLSSLGWINPDALSLITQRNGHIKVADSLQVGGDSIQNEWLDFISNWDLTLADLPLSILSHAINQAPQGTPTAQLPHLQAGQQAFALGMDLLTQGLQDPDGDPLSIQWLSTDQGDWFVADAATGDWVLDVNANGYNPDYLGPLELSYGVDDGHGHQLVVHQILVVEPANHLPSGDVMVSVAGGGALAQYATLQASDSLVDLDGMPGSISYAWYAGSIWLGSGSSLQLSQANVGQSIHVEASYIDGLGKAETVSSLATAPVANVDDPASGSLGVTGSAAEGGTLTAVISGLDDPDGAIAAVTYQWEQFTGQSWAALSGKTNASLAIPDDQSLVGATVRVTAISSDVLGGSTSFIGAGQVIANVNDAPTGVVAIAGTPVVGQTLAASNTLVDADGIPAIGAGAITYQWNANGIAITGATGSSYVVAAADVGKSISATASYVDLYGTHEAVTSPSTAVVSVPADTTPPALSSIGLSGNTLAIAFSEALASAGLPAALAFAVQSVSGTKVTTLKISSVALDPIDPRRLLLGLGSAPASSVGLRVSYVDPTGNQTIAVLQDQAGNDVASFTNQFATTFTASSSVTTLASQYVSLILGGSTAINGTANSNNNVILGNGAANLLNGGSGLDVLTGGLGSDTFRFDSTPNTATNRDQITDFVSGTDKLSFLKTVYAGFANTATTVSSTQFLSGASVTAATTTSQRFIYNTTSGILRYDRDGSAATYAPIEVALLGASVHPLLTASDFILV